MYMLNSALVSAEHPPLEQRGDVVDAWHHHVRRIRAGADDGNLMLVAGRREPSIAAPSIGVDHRTGHYGRLNERQEAGARHVFDAANPNPADALAIFFGCHGNDGLGLGFPAVPAFLDAADIGFVHLHCPAERVPAGADHGSAQLVQPSPGRLIAAQTENTLQPQGADTALLVGDVPHRHEPLSQWLAGVLKDRPGRQRRLPLAATAVQQPPRRHPRFAGPAAEGAYKPTRPAQAPDVVPTCGMGTKPLVNFLKRPGIINPRQKTCCVVHLPRLYAQPHWSKGDTLLFSYISPNAPSFLTPFEWQWLMPIGEWSDRNSVRIQKSGSSTASGLLSPSATCHLPPRSQESRYGPRHTAYPFLSC